MSATHAIWSQKVSEWPWLELSGTYISGDVDVIINSSESLTLMLVLMVTRLCISRPLLLAILPDCYRDMWFDWYHLAIRIYPPVRL